MCNTNNKAILHLKYKKRKEPETPVVILHSFTVWASPCWRLAKTGAWSIIHSLTHFIAVDWKLSIRWNTSAVLYPLSTDYHQLESHHGEFFCVGCIMHTAFGLPPSSKGLAWNHCSIVTMLCACFCSSLLVLHAERPMPTAYNMRTPHPINNK